MPPASRPRPHPTRSPRVRAALVGLAVAALTAGWLTPAGAAPTTPTSPAAPAPVEPAPATPEVRELAVPAVVPATGGARRSASTGRARPGTVLARLAATRTPTFSTVGVTWAAGTDAQPRVEVRVRADGAWSGWEALASADDADGAEAAGARPGTEPRWFGDATGVEVRLRATADPVGATAPADVRVALVDPQVLPSDAAPTAVVVPPPAAALRAAGAPKLSPAPAIVTRARWGADEKLRTLNGKRCAKPDYDTTLRAAIVHHTAGANRYSRSDSAAIVRGIYAFHTQQQGLVRHRLQLPRRPVRHASSRAATAASGRRSTGRTPPGGTPRRSGSR